MNTTIVYLIILIIILIANNKIRDLLFNKKESEDYIEKDTKQYDPEKDAEIIKQTYVQTNLLTPTEFSFYKQLQELLKNYNIDILFKVRLADIFKVKNHNRDYNKNFSRIKSKHIDFLLLDKNTVRPVIAIELDDASHDKKSSFKNDNFKNAIFSISSIQLIRIKVQKPYNFTPLLNALEQYKMTNK